MSKKEFLQKRNAEKAAKRVAIAQTDINKNYDAQSVSTRHFAARLTNGKRTVVITLWTSTI